MSGRGQATRNGGRSGRGGRGSARSNGSINNSNKKKTDEKKKKFHPQSRGKAPEFSFEEVKKELVKALESSTLEKAEDIIDSVRSMELVDLESEEPVQEISGLANEVDRAAEQEIMKERWRYQMKKWDARVDALANNKRKLHAKILKFCSEGMEEKLERETDFDKELYDDPILLLKRIKRFMTTSEETDWEFFELWEAIKRLVGCHQGGNETPNAFRKRFEEHAKGVVALLGNDFLGKFARNTQGYEVLTNDVAREIYEEQAWEMLLASGLLYNCHRERYQSRVDKMNADYMVIHMPYQQRMTYPVTLQNATETLNRHKPDNRGKKNGKPGSSRRGNAGSSNGQGTSGETSGGTGLAFAQTGSRSRSCFVCGETDHVAPNCPLRFRPKEQWVRPDRYRNYSALQTEDGSETQSQSTQASGSQPNQSNMQTGSADRSGTGASRQTQFNMLQTTSARNTRNNQGGYPADSGWSFMQMRMDPQEYLLHQMNQDEASVASSNIQIDNDDPYDRLMEGVHLDSGSTFPLYANDKHLVSSSIKPMKTKFNYGSNVGSRDIYLEGDSKYFKGSKKKLDREAKASVESLSQLVQEGYSVYFNSDYANRFEVIKNGQRWFFDHNLGLYTFNPHQDIQTSDAAAMVWRQEVFIKKLEDLEFIDGSPELNKMITREKKVLRLMQSDLKKGNRLDKVQDMILRYRFGTNDYQQEKYVGGPITEKNMPKILHKLYDGIPLDYDGGIREVFTHKNLIPAHQELTTKKHQIEEEVSMFNLKPSNPKYFEEEMERRAKIARMNNDNNDPSAYCGVQTVKKNQEGFTDRQVKRANAARSGYHMAGAPDIKAFKIAVRSGLFKNCPLVEEDITMAEKIYGPSVSAMKGKTRRPTPKGVHSDWIEIPPELTIHNQKLELCVDLVFINNVVALSGIDRQVKYRHYIPLPSRTKTALYDGIDEIFRLYNHAGFTVSTIYCDREFETIFEDVKDELDVHMNYASAGEHEPTAERNNQHIKARFRTHYHRMPYKAIPRVMTKALGRRVANTSNYFPAKGGISQYYSPHMIILKRPIDYNKECVAEFGAYVQGYGHETHRNQRTRTIDGIYLGPAPNFQSGHLLMDLNTGQEVVRTYVRELPATSQVIDIVEEMARNEGVRALRTYSRKTGTVILDGDLLAGVDPDELWDEEYIDEDNDPTQNDHNLRNEHITQDEIDDLNEVTDDNSEQSDQEYEDEVVERLITRARKRQREDEDNEYDEEYEQPHNPEQDLPLSNEELEKTMDEMVQELMNLEESDREETIIFEDDKSEDNEEAPDLIERDGNNLDDNEDSDDEFDDKLVVNTPPPSKPNEEIDDILSPKHTRSNHNYMQKKRKANLKKNRSAMRKKARKKKLKSILYEKLKEHKDSKMKKSSKEYAKLKEIQHNLVFQQVDQNQDRKTEYSVERARLIAQMMQQIKDRVDSFDGVSFIQQYYITKGLKVFGNKGHDAAMKELDQLVKRNCWSPIDVATLSPQEKKRAVDAMMLLAQKNDGTIKGRCVFKGSDTRDWLSREDTASPTASHEGICSTCVIDAHEERDIMSVDIPNAFIQTEMPEVKEGKDRVIMKITGLLVDYMIQLNPMYRDYVVYENGRRVIYVVILRAIYGMLEASLLWYKKLRGDLENYGFVFNPYDPCIANKMVNGKQQTIRFHVDDLLSSHVDPKVNDSFYEWMNQKYGNLKKVTCTRGKVHTYLGMTLDFSVKGKVKIRMDDYVERMLEEFPVKFKEDEKQETPAGTNLLEEGKGAKLDEKRKEIFHSFVAKSLFLSKRARLDIGPTVAILASRVQNPNESDWNKLVRKMRYLHTTKKWHLTMSADDLRVIKWYVDASFAVHPDFRSHTGAVMTMGGGVMQSISRKQKLNSRSSTEAELIGVDDAMTQVLWTKMFMEKQGYPIDRNILYQDNKSSILLETNGRSSAGKRSRALNIRYFFVTDQSNKGNIKIEYMPTDDMWADYMTKPLQGEKFRKFRSLIMGRQD